MRSIQFDQHMNLNSSDQAVDYQENRQPSDPFGIKEAGTKAMNKKSWTSLALGKAFNLILLIVGILPILLIVALPVMSMSGDYGPAMTYLTIAFLTWAIMFVAYQLRLIGMKPTVMPPKVTARTRPERVVVIGAGPVGLSVVKECLEQQLSVRCVESKSGVGGVYRFDESKPSGVWKSARLTSSPWVTAFSDFPPSSPSSIHHNHEQYTSYLEDYTDHFKLRQNISFNTMVEKVKPMGDGWEVSIRNLKTDTVEVIECDRVSVCSGVHQTPKSIAIPGIDNFKGEIRHVASYKGFEDYVGKTVVVAGLGESGADITSELSKHAKKVILSIRRGKFVIPRINPLTGKANDYDTNRIRNSSPIFLKNSFMALKRSLCVLSGEHTPESAIRGKLLQVSQGGPNTQTATKSDDFIKALLNNSLDVQREIMCFDNDKVVFSDGETARADIVLFAHGYTPGFPFLELPEGVKEKHPSEMYLNMFDPDIGSSLAFCGFARPALGSIPPVGELQARLFAQIANGKVMLPAVENMRNHIKEERRENRESFPNLPEKNVVVSWIPYMDKLASLIGCRPDPWKLLRSPILLWRVLTGVVNGAQYRMHGVGANPIAQQTVLFLKGEHQVREFLTMLGLHFWVWPLGFIRKNRRFKSDISCI